jgi:hypothetical protein
MQEFDYLAEFTATNTGLFDVEDVAQPAIELLPNRPNQAPAGGVFDRFIPQNVSQPKPEISNSEIEEYAKIEADWILSQFQMFVGLGKGAISGVIYNSDDKRLLQSLSDSGQGNSEEAREILERFEIQKSLESTVIKDYETKRKIFISVIKLDLLKKQREGKLELPSISQYLYKMVASELVQITGNNPRIFSTIGERLLNLIKSKLPI